MTHLDDRIEKNRPDGGAGPHAAAEQQETSGHLATAMAGLTDSQQEVLRLKYV